MHGMSKTKGYKVWQRIFRTPKKGTSICSRWGGELDGYLNFALDMGQPPEGMTLLLKDGAIIYDSDNCIWGPPPLRGRAIPIVFIHDGMERGAGGVYILSFSNGTFYIGSTRNFRTRIVAYKTEMRDGYTQSKRIKEAIENSEWVVFKVIEHIYELANLKIREDVYIKQHADDDRLLNRAKNAFSNKGIKWTKEEIESMKKTLGKSDKRGRPRKKNNFQ